MTENDDQDIDGFFSTARVEARDEVITLGGTDYREYLYDLDDPALAPWRGMTYEEFTATRYEAPFLRELLDYWNGLYEEPFVGVTCDGIVQAGLYPLVEQGPTNAAAVAAAEHVLATLTPEQRAQVTYPVDAPQWRAWSNPEFVFHRVGRRLEDLAEPIVQAVYALIEASLSPEGYARLREVMALNGFLGELVDLPTIMNDRSYWFALYGSPSESEPWGWQLFGHHAAVNFLTVGGHDVIAPLFLGGEPALADDEHPPVFDARERVAVQLASSLSADQRARAVVYDSVLDPRMPEGRLHPADERHVAGAFRDNRVVAYEGIPAGELDAAQRAMLRDIVEDFHLLLRTPQREATLANYDAHLDGTWFSWYGATDGSTPFYLRVQSPVILVELDHHAGVWLNNRLPARFHVHTTLRLPNGNDYGRAYLAQWQAKRNS